MFGDECWRRDRHQRVGSNRPLDERRARHHESRDDAEVESVLDEVNVSLCEGQAHVYFWIDFSKAVDEWSQREQGKRARGDDAQRAARLTLGVRDGRFEMIQFFEQRAAAFEITRAGFSERQIAGGAVDEASPQMCFEHGDCPSDQRIRDVELLCGAAETFRIRYAHEDAHCMNLVHLGLPRSCTTWIWIRACVTRGCPVSVIYKTDNIKRNTGLQYLNKKVFEFDDLIF
ncbi:protein of unknown function [Caballeronia sp. S22]